MPSTAAEQGIAPQAPGRVVRVAAAAILNSRGECLIAQRAAHRHQGGLWEFPGGKIEPGEGGEQALARELHEELGIEPLDARPLITIRHDYPDKSVELQVWRVEAYRGEPHGREAQPLRWVAIDALRIEDFPAANRPIITALQLPERYLITPEPDDDAAWMDALSGALARGESLIQLRAKRLDDAALSALARQVQARIRPQGATLIVNGDAALALAVGAQGAHLSAERLMRLEALPAARPRWVAASCHDARELAQANRLGIDFVVAGPVFATESHPGAPTLGLDGLARLCAEARMPVYALGGLRPEDLPRVRAQGAQGIAAIRGLWGGAA